MNLLPTLIATRKALAGCIGDFSACRLVMTDDDTRSMATDLVAEYRTALAAADLAIAEAEKLAAEMATKELM